MKDLNKGNVGRLVLGCGWQTILKRKRSNNDNLRILVKRCVGSVGSGRLA